MDRKVIIEFRAYYTNEWTTNCLGNGKELTQTEALKLISDHVTKRASSASSFSQTIGQYRLQVVDPVYLEVKLQNETRIQAVVRES